MNKWNLQKVRLRRERGFSCELCKKPQGAEQQDHAIVPKAKYRKSIPELDLEENIILLCSLCNQRKPKKYWKPYISYSEWAWCQNCRRYGAPRMVEWMSNVPLKIKPGFLKGIL